MTAPQHSTLEVLPYDECIARLMQAEVGRLAWVTRGEQRIVPVNYGWDGSAVVFRTDPGAKVDALEQVDVAFEIDDFDLEHAEGWSVVVRGAARVVDPEDWPEGVTKPEHLYFYPWAPGPKDRWIRLVPNTVTGRRIFCARETGTSVVWSLIGPDLE